MDNASKMKEEEKKKRYARISIVAPFQLYYLLLMILWTYILHDDDNL